MVTKLQADAPPSSAGGAPVTLVTGYDAQSIHLNGQPWHRSVLLLPGQPPIPAPCSRFQDLDRETLRGIRQSGPQVLIIGSGDRGQLLSPELAAVLMARPEDDDLLALANPDAVSPPVGVESMATHAACRTYNLLVTEGRQVAALLFLGDVLEPDSPALA
jgi:uncharacterized protein